MSGIYGFATQNNLPNPGEMLGRMFDAIPLLESPAKRQWTAEDGCAGLGVTQPNGVGELQFASDKLRNIYCVFDGIIYHDNKDSRETNPALSEDAGFFIEQYLTSGLACLRTMNGSFNVCWWDGKAKRLILANDKLGHRLLFWGMRDGAFVFASLLARVMATGILSTEVDIEGFADLLNYGYILGARTLFNDVHILPPASYLIYEGGKAHIEQYWRLDHIEPHGSYNKHRLHDLEDIFKIAVQRSIRPNMKCAIDLTGGLDSRCILAGAINQQLPFVTHTGGQLNSTDVVIAKEISRKVKVKHYFELIDPDILSEWLVPMVLYQGGIIATLHCHPSQHLYSSFPFDAVIQGIGGEFARGSDWVSPEDIHIKNLTRELVMCKVSPKAAQRLPIGQLWRPEFRSIGTHTPGEHLQSLLNEYQHKDSPIAVIKYLSLLELGRKFLNKAILIVRGSREAYFPYFDHQWVEAIASLPIAERVNNKIQIDLIARLCPEIKDIPYTNDPFPFSVPLWKRYMAKGYRAIERRVLQKLMLVEHNTREIPTTYYPRWTRREIRDVLIALLYDPQAAFRTYLQWEVVESLLNQHFSGKKNLEILVAALTVFEISHKLWVAPYKYSTSAVTQALLQSGYKKKAS